MLNSSNTYQIPNHQLPKFQALMRLLKELKDQLLFNVNNLQKDLAI